VTTDDQDRVRFPYPNAVKVRPSLAERMRFWDPPIGSDQIQLYGPDQPGKDVYFLVEGESDTMCLWQQLEAEGKLDTAGVYGLPGVNTWRDEFAAKFESAKTVWVILDNDDPYENPQAVQSVEAAWPGIRRSLGRKAIRVRLPKGVNDICEFFLAYDMAALRVVLRSTPRASWHFAPGGPHPETRRSCPRFARSPRWGRSWIPAVPQRPPRSDLGRRKRVLAVHHQHRRC